MAASDFALRGEYIALDALLKATGLAESGGRAKALVAAGLVQVDGQTELRKTRKLRAGQVVVLADASIHVVAAAASPPAEADAG
jgi:ribosome-associated protein